MPNTNAKRPQWNDALKMQNPRSVLHPTPVLFQKTIPSVHTLARHTNFPYDREFHLKTGKATKKAYKILIENNKLSDFLGSPLNAWNRSVVWIQLASFLVVVCFIHRHPHPYTCVPKTMLFSRFGKERTQNPSQNKKNTTFGNLELLRNLVTLTFPPLPPKTTKSHKKVHYALPSTTLPSIICNCRAPTKKKHKKNTTPKEQHENVGWPPSMPLFWQSLWAVLSTPAASRQQSAFFQAITWAVTSWLFFGDEISYPRIWGLFHKPWNKDSY